MIERYRRVRGVAALGAALALTLAGCASDTGGEGETDAAASEPAAAAEPSAPAERASDPAEAPAEGDALLANVPEVEGGTQEGQENIQEGGIHIFATVDGAPADVVAAYETALETNGWTIEGSGGDPSGELGAGVQATRDDGRYLSLNVGGPGEGTAFRRPVCLAGQARRHQLRQRRPAAGPGPAAGRRRSARWRGGLHPRRRRAVHPVARERNAERLPGRRREA